MHKSRSYPVRSLTVPCWVAVVCLVSNLFGGEALLQEHCQDCHNDEKEKGKFNLKFLGEGPNEENLDYWLDALDLVSAGEMPPCFAHESSSRGDSVQPAEASLKGDRSFVLASASAANSSTAAAAIGLLTLT